MAPAPPLTDLIATVSADAASTDPLVRLATASATAAELTETSDALVGHFVDECRAAGHTWSEISQSLGVTRQAAHKRFSATPRELQRWTERAKQVLAASVDAARGLGHPFVGTEHLLLGLFPPGGIGATVLGEHGVTEQSVAERVIAHSPSRPSGPAEPPFTPLAAQVFGGALSEAVAMGHNYLGTEHLLLALFGQPEGLAAQILADAGATHDACKQRIAEMLVALTP